MADSENSTFNTSIVTGNEIVKAEDFNFGFESLVLNISKFAQMIFDCNQDFVIGGKVVVDSGTNVRVQPVFGVCSSTKEPFGMTELSDIISITQDDYHSRVDIIEAKGEWVTYDEQQRAFNDLDYDIVTYQNIDVKQRLKVVYRVKNGINDSLTAPETDEGWVKIAEINYNKGAVELEQNDIHNITSDVAGLENSEWTNEKTKTYNVNYISHINERFRGEHNEDGTHKDGIIHAKQVDFGVGAEQVNAGKIPITSSGSIGDGKYNAGDSVNATLVLFANQFATVYNAYVKYGINCFKGEVVISALSDEDNVLVEPVKFGAAGDGTAYCKIGTKNIFSITADGKLRMAAGYVPSDSMDVVTKEVTDTINTALDKINKRVTDLEISSDSTVYSNNVFSRFSYISGKIDAATTANIALSGLQTVDGISLSAGMLVLVKDQTDAKENGIYEVNSNAWQRHSEFATFALIKHKLYIIGGGSVNKNKIFYTPQENISEELGTFNLVFSEYEKINTEQIKDEAVTEEKIKDFSISLKKIQIQALFDVFFPIGITYPQYPRQKDPNELFGNYSTWEVIDYDGAFFRAEGGIAKPFIEEGGKLEKQSSSILSHRHLIDFTSSDMSTPTKVTTPGHTINGTCSARAQYGNSNGEHYNYNTSGRHDAREVIIDLSHTHHIHGLSALEGDTETRPANYTKRIWVRVA